MNILRMQYVVTLKVENPPSDLEIDQGMMESLLFGVIRDMANRGALSLAIKQPQIGVMLEAVVFETDFTES